MKIQLKYSFHIDLLETSPIYRVQCPKIEEK